MTCPDCKKVYNDHVTICISCGAELVPDEVPEKTEEITEGVFESTVPASEKNDAEYVRNITVTSAPAAVLTEHPKHSGVFKATASGLLTVLLFAVIMLTFGSFTARQFTQTDRIASVVRNFDLLSLPAAEIGIAADENATVGDAVAVMAAGSGLDSVKIRSVYENSTIKDFLCGVFIQYGSYLRDGIQPDVITPATLKSLFSENISVISVGTGYVISEKDLTLAFEHIDSISDLLSNFSVSALESRYGDALAFIRAYISVPVLVAGVVLAVLIIAALAAVNKTADGTLSCSGGAFLGAGLVIITLTFMLSMQIGFFDFANAAPQELARCISSAASGFMYSTGAVIAAFGTAALIWAATIKKLKKLP